MEESVLFTFPHQTNGSHEPCHGAITVGHVISERHWKSAFDFIEIVSNYGLKRGTVWQILGFIYTYNFENIFTA